MRLASLGAARFSRGERAIEEDENTRDESREMAADGYTPLLN